MNNQTTAIAYIQALTAHIESEVSKHEPKNATEHKDIYQKVLAEMHKDDKRNMMVCSYGGTPNSSPIMDAL